jgi:hypothetical protein
MIVILVSCLRKGIWLFYRERGSRTFLIVSAYVPNRKFGHEACQT